MPKAIEKQENDQYLISFSSEEYVKENIGTPDSPEEVFVKLSHSSSAPDLSRLNTVGPLLVDHDPKKQVGVIDKAWIEGRRGYALVRFSESELGAEYKRDVDAGIKTGVSVGFDARIRPDGEGDDTFTAVAWTPDEISIVSKPADFTVGFGRSKDKSDASLADALESEQGDSDHKDADRKDHTGPTPEGITKETSAMPDKAESNEGKPPVVEVGADEKRDAQILSATRSIRKAGKHIKQVEAANDFIEEHEESDNALEMLTVDRFLEAQSRKKDTPNDQKVTREAAETPDIGMSEKEVKRYSFCRMFNYLANPGKKEAERAAAFEIECSNAHRSKNHHDPESDASIPNDVLERDVYGRRSHDRNIRGERITSLGGSGANLVATDHLAGSFIENLRNSSIVMGRARQLTGLVGNVDIPTREGSTTAYWLGESDNITASDPTYSKRQLTPKHLGVLALVSRSQLLQSSIDVEADLRRDLAQTAALEVDRAALYGLGSSNQPRGVANQVGINTVTFAAVNPTWAEVVQMETEINIDNALMGDLGYLFHPTQKGYFKSTEKFGTSNGKTFIDDGSTELNGYGYGCSNQIVTGDIFFGNWMDLIIGMWGGIDLMVDPYSNSRNRDVEISMVQSMDVALRHAESFCLGKDA